MRIKLIAVGLLLTVSGVVPTAVASISMHPIALHTDHPAASHHTCCPPALSRPPVPPVPSPQTDPHRCCFLRGPASSLPASSAVNEKLLPASILKTATAVWLQDSSQHRLAALQDSRPVPPLSIQMSVVLRN